MKERGRNAPIRILYVSQFYPPESIAGAFRADEHSRAWVEDGAEVTVLTGWPNYPTGSVFSGYEVEMLAEEIRCGVRVLRSKLIAKPNKNIVWRVVNGTSFLAFGALNILFNGKRFGKEFDIVLASSGTIFAGYLGLLYAKMHHLPFVIEFRDITFEQMIATGALEKSLKVKAMRWLELHLAKASTHVVVLTQGFRKLLEVNGIDSNLISVVPNGADIIMQPHSGSAEYLILGYYGTMGISQDVSGTLDYVDAIRRTGIDARYILIGEGAMRTDVERTLQTDRYPFAKLMPGMSKEKLEKYYQKTDLIIVSLQQNRSFRATVPSKILQSFARGIPVLFIGPEGEAARLVRENGAGITLTDGRDRGIAALEEFFSNPNYGDELKNMGDRATKLIERSFTRKKLADQMLRILESAMGNRIEALNG